MSAARERPPTEKAVGKATPKKPVAANGGVELSYAAKRRLLAERLEVVKQKSENLTEKMRQLSERITF